MKWITSGWPFTQEELKVVNVLNVIGRETLRGCVVPGSKDQERIVPKTLYGIAASGNVGERC